MPLPAALASTTICWAWPSLDTPASITLVTFGTVARLFCKEESAVVSAEVSGPLVVAATTGMENWPEVPNGAARSAAFELGALAGRNFWLFPWVTLAREGS